MTTKKAAAKKPAAPKVSAAERRAANKTRLIRDARNRALRSFLQGLALDVGVAAAFVIYEFTSSDSPQWELLWLTLGKTIAQSAASYVMRRFADPSKLIPTPLPPDPPGEPDADVA